MTPGAPQSRRGSEDVFAALADPTRRHLVETLASQGSSSATALAAELPISRQAVAKHLAALGGAGLVEGHRAGRETLYELRPQRLDEAAKWIDSVGAEWDDRLRRLKKLVEGS
jgi:DNA-binding transcriptional ArsR family regulator